MPPQTSTDHEILEAALIGLQHQHAEYTAKIAEIRRTLGIRAPRTTSEGETAITAAPAKRKMSAAARKRIGEATRRRWMAFRKQKAEAEKPAAKPKRKLSKAGRAAIVAATKKRWAAVHKAQKAAATKPTPKTVAKKTAAKKTKKVAVKTPATPATAVPTPATT